MAVRITRAGEPCSMKEPEVKRFSNKVAAYTPSRNLNSTRPIYPQKKLALICWLVGRFGGGFIVIIDESSSSPTAARRLVAQRIKYTETRNDRAQAIIFAAFPGDPP